MTCFYEKYKSKPFLTSIELCVCYAMTQLSSVLVLKAAPQLEPNYPASNGYVQKLKHNIVGTVLVIKTLICR